MFRRSMLLSFFQGQQLTPVAAQHETLLMHELASGLM
jgi:hypothetical protein